MSSRGKWHEWILFFLRGVGEQARDAAKRAKTLEYLQRTWHSNIVGSGAPTGVLALADSLFEFPYVTIPIAQSMLGTTYNTARSYVKRLTELGILEQLGDDSYNRIFRAPDILRIAGEDA